jgi:hypothetical protein
MFVEQHGAILNIIDVGADLVHAVGRFNSHDIVDLRTAKHTVDKIYRLIRAVAEKDVAGWYLFDFRELALYLLLKRIWIAIVGAVVRVLVGIEENVSLVA